MTNDIDNIAISNSIPKKCTVLSLYEKSSSLQSQLQYNRNIFIHNFIHDKNNQFFPRSYTMRFLMENKTKKLLRHLIGSLIGIKTVNAVSSGINTAYFAYRTMIKRAD